MFRYQKEIKNENKCFFQFFNSRVLSMKSMKIYKYINTLELTVDLDRE